MSEPTPTVSSGRYWNMWLSLLAFLQTIAAGTALADVLDPKVYGLVALTIAALQVGTATYMGTSKAVINTSQVYELNHLKEVTSDGTRQSI